MAPLGLRAAASEISSSRSEPVESAERERSRGDAGVVMRAGWGGRSTTLGGFGDEESIDEEDVLLRGGGGGGGNMSIDDNEPLSVAKLSGGGIGIGGTLERVSFGAKYTKLCRSPLNRLRMRSKRSTSGANDGTLTDGSEERSTDSCEALCVFCSCFTFRATTGGAFSSAAGSLTAPAKVGETFALALAVVRDLAASAEAAAAGGEGAESSTWSASAAGEGPGAADAAGEAAVVTLGWIASSTRLPRLGDRSDGGEVGCCSLAPNERGAGARGDSAAAADGAEGASEGERAAGLEAAGAATTSARRAIGGQEFDWENCSGRAPISTFATFGGSDERCSTAGPASEGGADLPPFVNANSQLA